MTENIYFLAGLEKCKQGAYQEAIESFTQSLNLVPQHLESYFNRALARQKLGEYQKALKDYDEAINLAPYNAEIYSERGVVKHLLKDNRGAIEDLNKALSLEPSNPYRYSSRAYIRAFIGDNIGAIEDYEKAINLDPQDAISLNNLGLLEEKLGRKQSAASYFQRADQIADKGKTFEKPDLEEILKKHEEKEKIRLESERLLKQPKGTGADGDTHSKPSTQEYIKVIKSVFTSRETFKEFITFVKNPFRRT